MSVSAYFDWTTAQTSTRSAVFKRATWHDVRRTASSCSAVRPVLYRVAAPSPQIKLLDAMAERSAILRERAIAVKRAGERLAKVSSEARGAWIADAASALIKAASEAREPLADSTGLSPEMVDWAVRTTLETCDRASLEELHRAATADGGSAIEMLSVVLAGNLFTATVRAMLVPLLLGVPVLAKTSSRERMFPAMLAEALRNADAELAEAVELVSFAGGDEAMEAALLEHASAVAVYGSDETISAIQARHRDRPLIAHGHGLSAAYCGREALGTDRANTTLEALALDIAAYDQRGCLSPQVVYVEAESSSLVEIAERLGRVGLAPLAAELPRGPLPIDAGAAQAQWRGLAEATGALIQGQNFAIAAVDADELRWSPGYRNVSLVAVEGPETAADALATLGSTLKCVGVDQASADHARTALATHQGLNAYTCRLGTMQTPALDAPSDGKPVWHGLLR